MKVEVLYIADCPNHKPAVERAREVLRGMGLPQAVDEVEIRAESDAKAKAFLGSPTVRIDGMDVEPEARQVQHFGFGCRSYLEDGRRSGLPSNEMILRAVREIAAGQPALRPRAGQESSESRKLESGTLIAGGIAAMLASTCCLGPLILVALGFSGAWIGNLTSLEPYRPFFIGGALIALFFAGKRIFRPIHACSPADACAVPATRRAAKVFFGVVVGLVVVAIAFPYVAKFFY